MVGCGCVGVGCGVGDGAGTGAGAAGAGCPDRIALIAWTHGWRCVPTMAAVPPSAAYSELSCCRFITLRFLARSAACFGLRDCPDPTADRALW